MNPVPTLLRLNSAASTKDQIISVLSSQFPLSAKQLFNQVARDSGGVSYQAIHKALKELESAGIIIKKGQDYELDINWIGRSGSFFEQLRQKYSNSRNPNELVFSSIHEVDGFLIDFLSDFLKETDLNGEKPVVCMHWSHFWIPLFLNKKTYQRMKDAMALVEVYSATSADTPVDRWSHSFWKEHLIHTVYGVKEKTATDTIVVGDVVVQVFYPKELRKMLDKEFSSAKSVEELDLNNLFCNVFERKAEIPVVISKNKALAEQLREQVLGYFE